MLWLNEETAYWLHHITHNGCSNNSTHFFVDTRIVLSEASFFSFHINRSRIVRTATFAMRSTGNSASALGQGSHPPSTTDCGNYKVVLPRLQSGNTILNSVFLHADLAGRPYRATDFHDALLSVLNATDILGAGQYQMSHLWLVTCVNSIAKQKLVGKCELLVKGLKCLVIDPECKNIKMELLWLPPHLKQRRIVEALEPYGTVQSITREMWRCDGMEGWQMTNRDVVFTLKDGVSASNLPHLLSIYGHQCLILVPGRPPLCLQCNRVGHIRRQCRTLRCSNCHRYGHRADACIGTYADKLRGNRPAEDDTITDHLMDVSEVVDATGETLPETYRQEQIKPSSADNSLSQKPASEDETKAPDDEPTVSWAESPPVQGRPPSVKSGLMCEATKSVQHHLTIHRPWEKRLTFPKCQNCSGEHLALQMSLVLTCTRRSIVHHLIKKGVVHLWSSV
ncbi:uncharacterized protein [Dermacentor andersoni]|uniref:uncharacterized protein n=1 Tax=Dermacentor andersoni TaxID=34620 RepID=UPI002416A63D|nr:uncharacterized protein LOC126539391 [Dermacentor andersoni]